MTLTRALPFLGLFLSLCAFSAEKCITSEKAIEDIRKIRVELENKSKALDEKEKELQAQETALKDQILKLENLKKELTKLEGVNGEKQEEKVAKLVETLEKMSPKKAAGVIEGLGDSLAIMTMTRLSSDKLAKVLNSMDAELSAYLSELLAGGKPGKRPQRHKDRGQS